MFAIWMYSWRAAAVASAQYATSEDRFVKSQRSLDVGDGEKVRDGKPVLRRHLIAFSERPVLRSSTTPISFLSPRPDYVSHRQKRWNIRRSSAFKRLSAFLVPSRCEINVVDRERAAFGTFSGHMFRWLRRAAGPKKRLTQLGFDGA